MHNSVWSWGRALLVAGAFACSDGSGVGLTFTTRTPGGGAAQNGDSTMVVRGNDTLVIRSVELVIREIELERIDDLAGCADSAGHDDDACEEFSVGVQLVDLPLGDQADKIITVDVGAGMFDELEFEIHKPDEDKDAAFVAANPAFANISIRATGTLSRAGSRTDFVYTTDLNEEQEMRLDPPLDVPEDATVNLTIRLDIATWFVSGATLVDPATANKGGENENRVRDNIRASIDAFHDDDGDGRDDDGEDNGGHDDKDDDKEEDDDNSGPGGQESRGPGV